MDEWIMSNPLQAFGLFCLLAWVVSEIFRETKAPPVPKKGDTDDR